MASEEFKIKGIGRMQAMLKPGLAKKEVQKTVGKATGRNAQLLLKAIRKAIQSGNYAPNAALTVDIKGSSKALVDSGNLFQAITATQQSPTVAFVGILRTDEAFNVGVAIHEGFTTKVTEKMRGLFFILWLASQGSVPSGELTGRAKELFARFQGWKPLNEDTTEIRVPARRFIGDPFENSGLKRKIVVNWNNAVREGLIKASNKK